jgi:uncharacterized protein YdgA (DUF945 family)
MGQQAETTVRQFIEQQNEQSAGSGVTQELVSYEKSLLGGKAITKLKFEMPPLGEAIGEVQFVNNIQNGPIFFGGNSGIQFGASRIHTQVDMEALDAEDRQVLNTLFDGKAPLDGHTVIGFGGDTSFDFSVNPLKFAEEGTTMSLDGVQFSGDYGTDMVGDIDMRIGKFEVKDATTHLQIPNVDVTGTMKGMVAGQVLGSFDMQAPQVSILADGTPEPILFDLAIKTNSDVQNNEAQGSMSINADNIKGVQDTVTKVNYQLEFAGLDVEGLKAVSQLQAEMQNALSQTDWNAESMETPEGQKKQQELMEKINSSSEQMMGLVFNKVLKTGKSRVRNVLKAESPKGKLNADIDLTYTGQGSPSMMDLIAFGPNDWAKMVQGKVLLDADKAMLPEGTEMLLMPLSEQGLLKVEGEKVKSEVTLAGENVTLNGQQMTFADFLHLVSPGAGMDTGTMPDADGAAADLGIPPDLMERIQNEGMTPEVMQALEESDDVPSEALEMFKQLQQMEQSIKAAE